MKTLLNQRAGTVFYSSPCMRRIFFFVLVLVGSLQVAVAAGDSLFVRATRGGWELWHRSRAGETLADISYRYSVDPELLRAINRISTADSTEVFGPIQVPVSPLNVRLESGSVEPGVVPLYYRVLAVDGIIDLCRLSGAAPRELNEWNPGNDSLYPGKVLLLGWLRTAPDADSRKYDVTVELKDLWEDQTLGGRNGVQEKGSAGFYNLTVQTEEAAWLAFHNSASKGSVIRVRNMNNNKMIFVKVIGPLPAGKQFHGCVLGLSNVAKNALGVSENKVFCEMNFAGY